MADEEEGVEDGSRPVTGGFLAAIVDMMGGEVWESDVKIYLSTRLGPGWKKGRGKGE